MKETILVTGATGNIGREIISNIDKTLFNIRGTIKSEKDAQRLPKGVEPVILNFEDIGTFSKALKGVSKVFLMRPPQMGDPKKFHPFIDVCRELKIKQIVFLSLLGVQHNPLAPHGYIEKYIIKSGIPYTLLRPSFFMQNLSTTHCKDIKECNEIIVPAGKGKTSFIDSRDVGAFGAKVFESASHLNRAYDLTGSEALDYYQVADIISDATKKKVIYTNPSSSEFVKRMKSDGVAKDFVKVMKGIYLVAKLRLAGKITRDFVVVMGREPLTFKQFAEDNKKLFI